jgi:Pycsar effector protein
MTMKPPSGFGEQVNAYLNDYVRVADAKAAAFLAANLGVSTLVLTLDPGAGLGQLLHWLSLTSFAVSVTLCAWVVFPRLPKGRMGVVFWEDIRKFQSPSLYETELQKMDAQAVESEYAAQNWFVSRVLHDKFVAIQRAVWSFLVAIACAALSYLVSR